MSTSGKEELQSPCNEKGGLFTKDTTVVDKFLQKPEADNSEEKLDVPGKTWRENWSGGTCAITSFFNIDKTTRRENKLTSNCYACIKRIPLLVWVERVFLISICTAVAVGFTVPIIIYAVDTDRGDNGTVSIDFDLNNCPASNTIVQVSKIKKYCQSNTERPFSYIAKQ